MASVSGVAFDVAATTVDDMAGDAAAFLPKLANRNRFSKVSLVGHSEGGLLALLVAGGTKVDNLVLVSTGGRPLRAIVREQLAAKLDAPTMTDVDRLLGDIAAGRPLERVPPPLAPLSQPDRRDLPEERDEHRPSHQLEGALVAHDRDPGRDRRPGEP
ncbi:MAG: hypothetical protein QM751_07280 [Paludibacteraceae bacterium]